MTEEEYQADKARRAELTTQTLTVTGQSSPTPTQEENDKLRLGLMHPDDKVDPGNPEMPPLGVQQAYMAGVTLPQPPDTVMGARGGGAPGGARRVEPAPATAPPKPAS